MTNIMLRCQTAKPMSMVATIIVFQYHALSFSRCSYSGAYQVISRLFSMCIDYIIGDFYEIAGVNTNMFFIPDCCSARAAC